MSGYRVRHDLDDDPTVHDGQLLDEPLPFKDGTAVVDDEDTARNLARRHTHLAYDGKVYEDADEEEAETCDEEKEDGEVCGRELPCPYHSDDEE